MMAQPSTSRVRLKHAASLFVEESMSETSDALELEVTNRGPHVTIRIGGEIDLATSARLATTLDHYGNDGSSAVTLDLSRVTFFDSSGVRVLVDAVHGLEQSDRTFALAQPSTAVRRVLEMSGVIELFTFEGDGDSSV
jgi:anti-sigma B factor antagonist